MFMSDRSQTIGDLDMNTEGVLRMFWNRAKIGVKIPIGPVTLLMKTLRTQKISGNRFWQRRQVSNEMWRPPTLASMGTATSQGVALIVGVGPGVGAALARRFAAAGMNVAVATRDADKLAPLVAELNSLGRQANAYGCNATDEISVKNLFQKVDSDLGAPDLVVYNCEAFGPGGILETNPSAFENCWKVNCFGAFLVSRSALPSMLKRGRGTIIFTGPTGSLRGRAGFVNLAVGKSGARMLAQSMAREFSPQGIHVAHVVIDGPVLTPMNADTLEERGTDGLLHPDAVAETMYQLHLQHKTCWTHELDLRPSVEPF
jgi:NAD(P)-dependent dehydrogenase (short-subunit alcohol dehydrogenase family)